MAGLLLLVISTAASGQGACCLPEAVCVPAVDEAECNGLGGVFLDGLDCADDPCAVGACCNDSFCNQADAWSCITAGRDFIGAGLDCVDDPCAIGVGACCFDGTCETIGETDCAAGGGIWLGSGANCTLAPCIEGACCAPGTCEDTIVFLCSLAGGTFIEGGLCADDGCDIPNDCPGDALFGQSPDGPEIFTAYVSELSSGFVRFENYVGVAGSIEGLRWFGLDLAFVDGDFEDCDEVDPTFLIAFHANNGGQPGEIVCSHKITATVTGTGIDYLGSELKRYDVELPSPCLLVAGWVSIAGLGDPSCWFLWVSGQDGDGLSWCDGCSSDQQDDDLSLCLLGTFGEILGACCNLSTGDCAEEVSIEDCIEIGFRFEPGDSCAQAVCTVETGACCFDDGAPCDVLVPADCIDAGGDWLGADSSCDDCPVFGACCFDQGECAIINGDDCIDEGYTFLGAGTACDECPDVPTCGDGTLFGLDPDGPSDFVAGTSEAESPFTRFQDFAGVTGPIESLTWWGVDLLPVPPNAWEECEEIDPTFEIRFYVDAGGVPGALVCSATVLATRTEVGLNYLGTPLLEYTAVLPEPCVMTSGWVSIVGLGDPTCWFLWMSAGLGGSYCDGCADAFPAEALAICLEGAPGGVFGACCNQVTGECADDVEITKCQGPDLRFEPDTACADLDPPCGVILGACCFDDGTCFLLEAADCMDDGQSWLGPNTTCAQCPCVVLCPGNSTPEGEGDCFDFYVDEFNGGCTSEAQATSPIAVGETVCATSGVFWNGKDDVPDFDWYEAEITESMMLEWTINASFPVQAWIIDAAGGCPGEVLQSLAQTTPCAPLPLSVFVTPGTYWLVVAPAGFSDEAGCPAPYYATLGPVTDTCPADVNSDGVVDVQDLTAVILAWGGPDPDTDINGDGIVDVQDLTAVIVDWGACPLQPATGGALDGRRRPGLAPGASSFDDPARSRVRAVRRTLMPAVTPRDSSRPSR